MKYFTRHKPSGARAERSIFGTIFKAMVGVLLVEVALLVASIYAMRVGPQLDQNAEDILAMQVENRSRYIQTTLNDAQELSTLESEINTLTQELLASACPPSICGIWTPTPRPPKTIPTCCSNGHRPGWCRSRALPPTRAGPPPSPIGRWPEAFSMRRSRRPMTMVPS